MPCTHYVTIDALQGQAPDLAVYYMRSIRRSAATHQARGGGRPRALLLLLVAACQLVAWVRADQIIGTWNKIVIDAMVHQRIGANAVRVHVHRRRGRRRGRRRVTAYFGIGSSPANTPRLSTIQSQGLAPLPPVANQLEAGRIVSILHVAQWQAANAVLAANNVTTMDGAPP